MAEAPPDDVSLFGLTDRPRITDLHDSVQRTGSSCLFVRDTGTESALA